MLYQTKLSLCLLQFLTHIVSQWPPHPSIPPSVRFQVPEGNPSAGARNSRILPSRKLWLGSASQGWVPHLLMLQLMSPPPCMPTEAFHRRVPANPLHSFQNIWLGHSTAVDTRKAALKVAFKAVNWWRCQHIVFIPKSWSLFWDHLRASKAHPLARKLSMLLSSPSDSLHMA